MLKDSPAFEFAAEELERATDLTRLEARGTLRLAVRRALFDALSIDVAQITMVVERLLPRELRARGVKGHDSVCQRLVAALRSSDLSSSDVQSPDAIFDRLIRR